MILLSHRIYINRKEQRHLALLPKHIPPVKPMKLYIFLNRLSNFGIKTYTRVAKIVEFPPYTSYPVSVSPNVILSHYCGTLSKPKIKTAPVRLCEPKSRLYFNLTSFSIHVAFILSGTRCLGIMIRGWDLNGRPQSLSEFTSTAYRWTSLPLSTRDSERPLGALE